MGSHFPEKRAYVVAARIAHMAPNIALFIPSSWYLLVIIMIVMNTRRAAKPYPIASSTGVVPDVAKYVEIAAVAADAPIPCK